MRRSLRQALNALVLAILFGTLPAFATTTEVRLLLSHQTARPGDTVTAGISLHMQPGWHSYWVNPGDSGLATSIKWDLPPGVTAGQIQWPVPEKLVTPPLTTYVYVGEAILLVPLKIDANAPPGPLDIKANVSWQECDPQVCVPGHETVAAKLNLGAESKASSDATVLEAAKAKLPKTESPPAVNVLWEKEADSRPLLIEWTAPDRPAEADFFPYAGKQFDVANDTERLRDAEGKVRIRKMVTKSGPDWPTPIEGLLVTKATKDSPPVAYEVTLTPAENNAALATTTAPEKKPSFIAALCFAFLGGLILNIMPCVLPVIALKVLGFVNQAKEEPGQVRMLGVIYGLGVLVSFLILAGIAIAVQHAGGLAGWSTAFQNPQFRVIITVLITLVALNLFGVFEVTLSGKAMGAAAELTGKQGVAGAFFNGVLATLLATPCTAPFLAPAIAFAFTQPPLIILLMFTAVACGLAAPFVLLCWQPAWLKFLPKPGLWMQRFKVAMGFPMLATAVWLFWVTATRMGKTGVLWFGLFLVVIALAAWIWGEFVQRGTRRAGLAMVISLLFVGGAYGLILERQLHWRSPNSVEKDAIVWQPWSPDAVQKARSEGHPVLVDFTADTCLNCKVNLITSIDIKATRDKLREMNVVTLEGDFTDEDPAIARELKRFDRPGVPLVLVYPANKALPPIVLPPVLTPSIVQDALNQAAQPAKSPQSASNN